MTAFPGSNFDHLGCIRKLLVCSFQENYEKYMFPLTFLTEGPAKVEKRAKMGNTPTLGPFFTNTHLFFFGYLRLDYDNLRCSLSFLKVW